MRNAWTCIFGETEQPLNTCKLNKGGHQQFTYTQRIRDTPLTTTMFILYIDSFNSGGGLQQHLFPTNNAALSSLPWRFPPRLMWLQKTNCRLHLACCDPNDSNDCKGLDNIPRRGWIPKLITNQSEQRKPLGWGMKIFKYPQQTQLPFIQPFLDCW